MIFCAVALGAVVFLQNLEINGNAAVMKLQGLEVQQKNNTFLINLECVGGKSNSPSSTTVIVPQEKTTACVITNQTIGDYITGSNSFRVDEEIQGNPYTFKDVMSVVDVCSASKDPSLTNSVKFEHGKSLFFHCPDTAAKKNMEIVGYR
jgi:hypothetical protein